jgi:tetratricopeptide (TPR) repeat protein/cytoskeletal protein CcmA (bactofilin family)
MLLLRRKHEPQPTIDPPEPANSPENSTQIEASPQTDAPHAASDSPAEALPEKAPISEKAAIEETAPTEPASTQERRLVIAAGISFRGEIAGCDRLVIDGAVEGEIKACRHIAVSEGAAFKGIALADDADIAGSCAGSLMVQEKLFVARTARVFGSVRYGRLAIEEGGELDGEVRRLKADGHAELPLFVAMAAPVDAPVAERVVPESKAVAKADVPTVDVVVVRDTGLAEIERMFAAALSARDLSRFAEAEALFKSVVAKRPDHPASLANLGKLARQRGDRAEALTYFEAAAKVDPQNTWARCDAAAMLHELARASEAEAIYKSVLEADAKHVGALSGLGQLAKDRGDKEAALAHFEAAVAADPANPWVRCDAANMLRELARYDEAEMMFKTVLGDHPEHGAALTGLGHLARRRRDRAGALNYFEAAAKADPRNPWVRCDLANILRELSRFGEAETMLKSVIENDQQHVGALTGLGHIARQRGELDAARGYFETALKVEPQNPDLRCELAAVFREASRLDEAENVLKAVIETHPQHAAALTALGQLARQREDRAATLRWFEAAVAAEPDDVSIRVEFARALRQQGEFARARQIIEKVLDDEPSAASA